MIFGVNVSNIRIRLLLLKREMAEIREENRQYFEHRTHTIEDRRKHREREDKLVRILNELDTLSRLGQQPGRPTR